MPIKYYEFHFAEVMGAEVINVGILFYESGHSFLIEDLKYEKIDRIDFSFYDDKTKDYHFKIKIRRNEYFDIYFECE